MVSSWVAFACSLGFLHQNAFNAELMGVILAIENAHMRGWNNLIIECDSMLAVFHLCNRLLLRHGHLVLVRQIVFLCLRECQFGSLIYFGKRNRAADTLANMGALSSY